MAAPTDDQLVAGSTLLGFTARPFQADPAPTFELTAEPCAGSPSPIAVLRTKAVRPNVCVMMRTPLPRSPRASRREPRRRRRASTSTSSSSKDPPRDDPDKEASDEVAIPEGSSWQYAESFAEPGRSDQARERAKERSLVTSENTSIGTNDVKAAA